MLTGKDIWDAYGDVSHGASKPWEDTSVRVQDIYNVVADKLNVQLSKAGEEASAVEYSAETVKFVLVHGVVKHMQEWKNLRLKIDQDIVRDLAINEMVYAFDMISNILPDDIRPLVRQILALYEQATKEE